MLDDLNYAVRSLRRSPRFFAIAALTLALATGANVALFSVADAVLFRPLPYADPAALFVVRMIDTRTGTRTSGVPHDYLLPLQRHSGVLSVGVRGPTTMWSHAGSEGAISLESFSAEPEYLSTLGVQPIAGRLFVPDDTRAAGQVALLTYEGWQHHFGGDPAIVGKTVRLGPNHRTIVGILPRGLIFPSQVLRYLYSLTGRVDFVTISAAHRGDTSPIVDPVVRLRPGTSRAQAQAELDALTAPLRQQDDGRLPVLEDPRSVLFASGAPVLALLVAGAGFLLLIGCVNVVHLMLTRGTAREREIGIRSAMGATRSRILRPLLFEGLLIGTAGGLLGWLLALASFQVLLAEVPAGTYGPAAVGPDLRVAAFAAIAGLVAGALVGTLPAWRLSRLDVRPLIGGPQSVNASRRFGRVALVLQATLAVVLVCGAIAAADALLTLLRVPFGFDANDVAVLHVEPDPGHDVAATTFYARALDVITAKQYVVAAGAAGVVPVVLGGQQETATRAGHDAQLPAIHVLDGFFEASRIRIVSGRTISRTDVRDDAGVAVLSTRAARLLFPEGTPLGGSLLTSGGRRVTVVGVAEDVLMFAGQEHRPDVWITPGASPRRLALLVRTQASTPWMLEGLRGELAALTPRRPVTAVWWAQAIANRAEYRDPRFQSVVLGMCGVLAIALTAMGMFALVAFIVSSRTRELGIRLALGALPRSLLILVLRHAFSPVLAGIAIGLLTLYWLRPVVEPRLAGVDLLAPHVVLLSALAVFAAAMTAGCLCGRRAARVDPLVALRAD